MKLRRFSEPLIGPLASWELVRLARRGHAHRARLLVLYLICLALVLTPFLWFGDVDPRDLASFKHLELSVNSKESLGQLMAICLWEAVLLGVAAMMPGFATLAVAQEKERDTLQMLLTTPLSDREIVLGKAVGRLGFVLVAAAAALPLISATALFGFVDVRFMIGGCILTCSTATLCAAIGVQAACMNRDLRKALIQAYGMTALALIGIIFGPFVVLYLFIEALNSNVAAAIVAIGYPLLQLAAAAGFFQSAIKEIRRDESDPISDAQRYYIARDDWRIQQAQAAEEKEQNPSKTKANFLLLPYDKQLERLRAVKQKRRRSKSEHDRRIADSNASSAPITPPSPVETPLPPIPESDPLLWKERYVSGRNTGTSPSGQPLPLTILIAGLALLLIVIGTIILFSDAVTEKSSNEYGGHLWLAGSVLAGGVYLVPCAIGLAAAIARERHKKTLETLLSLPIDRREILRKKVRAVLERAVLLVPLAILGPGIAFGVERDWRLGLAASGFVVGGIILVIGLGTLLSVQCPTEVRALRFVAPVVVLVLGVPVAVWNADNAIAFRWALFDLVAFGCLAAAAGLASWFRASRMLERLE